MMSAALKGINTTCEDEQRRKLGKIEYARMTRANTSHAVSVCETEGNPQLVRKPSDWMASSRASLVQHGPTKTVFEIFARSDLSQDDILTPVDFRARLVHAGEGATPPTDADLEVLCGEAVLMALFLVGLAWPVAVNPN
jgi:hypothetical protein